MPVCPKCGASKIAKILWGMPAYTEEVQRDLKDGKIVLGGCEVFDNDPTWQCTACGLQIYRK